MYVPLSLSALYLLRVDGRACAGITPKANGDAPSDPPPQAAEASPEALPEALSALDAQLRTLYAALPARTALVVFTGHSDPRRMSELNARKGAFEGALKAGVGASDGEAAGESAPKWTSADGRELEEEVEKARRGLLFLGVKA